MKSFKNRRSVALLLGVSLAAIASPAMAQDAPQSSPTSSAATTSGASAGQTDVGGPDTESLVGDIVVTAQKRVERLQDVPLAVTAIGGDQLATRQISDTQGLVAAIPSLSYQQGTNTTNSSFRVRGVGTTLFSQGVEPSVSLVVDGVVSARQVQSFADFADLERIEVLRGPQGTLFGKNATAGVISIVTARPSRDFEVRGDVTIAEQDEYRARGTASGPLSDTMRIRLTGYYNNVGGFQRNVTTGRDYAGNEGYGIRGKFEWDATDNLNLLFSADYRKNKADCCQFLLVSTSNATLARLYAPVVASLDNRSVAENVVTGSDTDQKTFSLQGDWDLGSATVTSISAYQLFKTSNTFDNDGINTTIPIYTGGGTNAAKFDEQSGDVDLHNFTQELRIGSNGSPPLTYVAGVFYSNVGLDRGFMRRRYLCAAGTIGQPCTVTAIQSARSDAHLDSDSVSAFGQLEYKIVGGLKAIGGARIQYEKTTVSGVRAAPLLPGEVIYPASNPVSGSRSAHDTAVTGKAGLQYEFSRYAQTYVSYTRGYKGLGFDTEITADFANQVAVQPEHVNAYEIGFKGRTRDNSLSASIAVFRSDYTNLQIQANRSDPALGTNVFIQTNAGTSRSEGFELEATVRPSREFSVNGAFSYTKTSINADGLNCPLQFQGAAPVITGTPPSNTCFRLAAGGTPRQNVVGGTLPVSPRYRVTLSPRYEHDFGDDLSAFAQVNLNFQSKQQFAVEQDPLLVQGSYTLVDASAGLNNIGGHFSVTVFVKNIFNENYVTNLRHGLLLASTASPNDIYANFTKDSRRYFGVNLGAKF